MHASDIIGGNDDEIELVLLVAAHVTVAHHVEDEVVITWYVRCGELQFHLPYQG